MEKLELVCQDLKRLNLILNHTINIDFNEKIVFLLQVDDVRVVYYNLILKTYDNTTTRISNAEIQYINIFSNTTDEFLQDKYLKKGYTKRGLEMLTNYAFNLGVPYIYLNIQPHNIKSIKVAKSCNFQKQGNSYYKFHPRARELFELSLREKSQKEKQIIMEEFDNFNSILHTSNQNKIKIL